jgi:hypothetical protein
MPLPTCCICAQLIPSDSPPFFNEVTEKEIAPQRYECCQRNVCPACLQDQPRFRSYCPYCQKPITCVRQNDTKKGEEELVVSSNSALAANLSDGANGSGIDMSEKPKSEAAPDVLHFVDPSSDSINTLAIRYGVPAKALRTTNGIFSDHLLAARKAILIPGEYHKGGRSLSPRPVEGEEEEARKGKVRSFQVLCKVAE